MLIVGAGLAGIGAAHHVQERCPNRTYAVLEARADLGGTWDLFRYPGIRSDSDMHTLGYRFRPWNDSKAIVPGASILEYVRATARESGIDRHIRFHHKVVAAAWSSAEGRWTITAEHADTGETVALTCGFLLVCSGYYRYDKGYKPEFAGAERFGGEVVHPQHWPENLDYAGKRVVVVGSGATAITLVPAMASEAATVTMLQRSPSYVAPLPADDPIARVLCRVLPRRAAFTIVRWKNILLQMLAYQLASRSPGLTKKALRRVSMKELPADFDVDTHFTPRYKPGDQRICVAADADFFKAISSGAAEIVTDRIEAFTEEGIQLESGRELKADVIVTATGLNLRLLGGMRVAVDSEEIDLGRTLVYRGAMLNSVPNCVIMIGYTNASWTLKADLVFEYTCRLLNHMEASGDTVCVPRTAGPAIAEEPLIDLVSGYVLRSIDEIPKQGSREPWKLRQNYLANLRSFRHGSLEDGALRFFRSGPELVE